MGDVLGSGPRRAVLAFSWANLVLYQAHTRAPTKGADGAYWMKTSAWLAAELDALLLLVGLLTLAGFLATELLQRRASSRGRRWFALVVGASLALPLVGLVKHAIQATGMDTEAVVAGSVAVLGVAVLAGLAWLARAAWRDPERVLAGLAAVLIITAPFAAFVTGSTLHARYQYATLDLDAEASSHGPADPGPAQADASAEARVVVLVFDEFDRRIAFEDRPASLSLESLDRLVEEAVVAREAYSTASRTLLTIPALLTGLPVVAAEPLDPSDLRLELADGTTTELAETDTFLDGSDEQDADAALAGFYHPYCRLFDTDPCWWTSGPDGGSPKASRGALVLDAAADGLAALPRTVTETLVSPLDLQIALGTDPGTRYVDIYEETEARALDAAGDPSQDVTFVHFNIPHRPVVYDRDTGEIQPTPEASYLDNLALVDETIAQLRAHMQEEGVWNETALVVTGDHGDRREPERVGLPPGDPDEPFPDREVPLLVKPPEPGPAPAVEGALDNRIVHDLALGVLEGELATGEETAAFLEQNAPEPMDPDRVR